MKPRIKEIIIVEGKDDITAVKQAVDAHVIAVHGYSSFKKETIEKLKQISLTNDIIILTDPDFAGKKIRNLIQQHIPKAKHAFISRKEGTKNNNIGVENADSHAIIEALKKSSIIFQNSDIPKPYTFDDLIDNNLCYGENSKLRREKLGDALRIGYYNSKQLLQSLNSFNIPRESFKNALIKINELTQEGDYS
jgi:ribonuclease M5